MHLVDANTGEIFKLMTCEAFGNELLTTVGLDRYLEQHGLLHFISHIFSEVTHNSSVYLLYRVSNQDLHIITEVGATGTCSIETLEGVTVSEVGTPVTIQNTNRNYTSSLLSKIYYSPSISSGITMRSFILPGGSGPKGAGGVIRSETDWILKANTDYAIKLTNDSGNTIDIAIANSMFEC